MAPVPPSAQAKPVKSILKTSSSSSRQPKPESLFATSKKDKRRIKHAQLISKVTKSSDSKKPRRRRPNKKLVTTLNSLADALPDDFEDFDEITPDPNNNGGKAGSKPQDQVNIIKRKSIKSRPGALKRREKLEQTERERFAKNMAQMAVTRPAEGDGKKDGGVNGTIAQSSEKWAALRSFISQTLEQKPELKGLGT